MEKFTTDVFATLVLLVTTTLLQVVLAGLGFLVTRGAPCFIIPSILIVVGIRVSRLLLSGVHLFSNSKK